MTIAASMSACGHRALGDGCGHFKPIYLTEPAIAALGPHREAREKIAVHNATWEKMCGR